ncbi:MAG: DUF2330 domain-containing protein [Myxococcales bacterium]|nr:DUF2330 domain-containing protein [Myxococcales bacterium]
MVLATLLIDPAAACGGFFCNGAQPVEQTGERILFREDGPGEWTSFIEIQYQGQPADFAWVVPIPRVIDPETEVDVAPAGLFDALEEATAPRFVRPAPAAEAQIAAGSAGCGCGGPGFLGGGVTMPDTSGVEVVGAAVAGPYAVEVITAEEGTNLANWLQLNGYAIPASAWEPMDAYIDQGFAFLGLKLQPDTPAGPIDTLVVRCGSEEPTIPLLLTAIAAAPDMPITVYTLSDQRYVPPADWPELPFDHSTLLWLSDGETNYDEQILLGMREEQRAFITEYAQPAEVFTEHIDADTLLTLGHGTYLTRMHTYASPEAMRSDPVFQPDADAPAVDNVHPVYGYAAGSVGSSMLSWLLGLAAIGSLITTRRR